MVNVDGEVIGYSERTEYDEVMAEEAGQHGPVVDAGSEDAGEQAALVPVSRARGNGADRVREIKQLMVAGQYKRGATCDELAERWRLSPNTVLNYASEASRQVREQMGSPDDVRADVFLWLHEAARMARLNEDPKSLVSAAKELANVSGVAAPTKVELTGIGDLIALAFPKDET